MSESIDWEARIEAADLERKRQREDGMVLPQESAWREVQQLPAFKDITDAGRGAMRAAFDFAWQRASVRTEELPYISSHRLAEWAVESARQPGTWEEKAADFLHENTLREASGISIDEMYALCLAIERIQASEEQTFVSVNAARLLGKLKAIVSPRGSISDG